MATNEEILKAYARKSELQARASELRALIDKAESELDDVERDLQLAVDVDQVLDGIPISVSLNGSTSDMATLACGPGIKERMAHLYLRADKNCWAVRLNERYVCRDRFHGGNVVGLGYSWNKKQAREVAERWLKGDDSVLKDSVLATIAA